MKALRAELDQVGYFPQIVWDVVEIGAGGEPVLAWYVHPETTFGAGMIGRHLTVFLLTATRLVALHVDDHDAEQDLPAEVTTTTRAVSLGAIQEIEVSHVITRPETYVAGQAAAHSSQVALAINWGATRALDLDPVVCADPECDLDHGLSGVSTTEDLSLRVAADVAEAGAAQALSDFARALSAAVAGFRQ
jgi:hypothetical protein